MFKKFFYGLVIAVLCSSCVKVMTSEEELELAQTKTPLHTSRIDTASDGEKYYSQLTLDEASYEAELAYINGIDAEVSDVNGDIVCLKAYLSPKKELISVRRENGVVIALYRLQYIAEFDLYELPLYFEREEAYVSENGVDYRFELAKTSFAPVKVSYKEFYVEKNEDSAYSVGEITVSVTATTAGRTTVATTKAPIKSQMDEIRFDPVVEPWE